MEQYYRDKNRRSSYKYDNKKSSKGGEGIIYFLKDEVDSVIKVFHPGKINAKEDKLKVMIDMYNQLDQHKKDRIKEFCCWPTDYVYDKNGKFVGYKMPIAAGIQLGSYTVPVTRKKCGYSNDYSLRVIFAYNIAACFEIIHSYFPNVCLGDVSKANILVYSSGKVAQVHLIDLDSIQIDTGSYTYISEVHTPGYASPERLRNLKGKITQASDNFSLAILMFDLLMNYEQPATHPFNYIKTNGGASGITVDESIKRGNCFYVKRSNMYKIPDTARRLNEVLNPELIQCFRNTFDAGVQDLNKRTTAKQWRIALSNFYDEIENRKCANNPDHYSIQNTCPYCKGRIKVPRKKKAKSLTNNTNPTVNKLNPTINNPKPVAANPNPVVNTPRPVTTNSSPVVSTPRPVAINPSPAVNTPRPVINNNQTTGVNTNNSTVTNYSDNSWPWRVIIAAIGFIIGVCAAIG